MLTLAADSTRQPCASSDTYIRGNIIAVLVGRLSCESARAVPCHGAGQAQRFVDGRGEGIPARARRTVDVRRLRVVSVRGNIRIPSVVVGVSLGKRGAVIVAGLLFLLMVVSGSLLSLGKARNDRILALHNVGSVLTVIAISGAIYLLTRVRW